MARTLDCGRLIGGAATGGSVRFAERRLTPATLEVLALVFAALTLLPVAGATRAENLSAPGTPSATPGPAQTVPAPTQPPAPTPTQPPAPTPPSASVQPPASPPAPAAATGWFGDALKNIESIVRIVAVLIGGAWAYMKFLRGRVFTTRLEPTLTGKLCLKDDHDTLAVSLKVRNVGLSRVDLRQDGTGYRISAAEALQPQIMIGAQWKHLGTFPILERHDWIEPGETVTEDRLILLPKSLGAPTILVEALVGSRSSLWVATAIVAAKEDVDE